ncbi:type II toxin-antitoxin system HicB family antitoxin [Candidatus Peregrinibacteria bacterium]|jgi:predicted RNase H-like HicB family nuclease|nr:type II toxin-antitoxin system HicB family antitoxin [Candidatus Peregrinibacteria bacterium]
MQFPIIVYQDEDGMFVGEVPTLKGCGSSSKTLQGLYKNLEDAVKLYLEVKQNSQDEKQTYSYFFNIMSIDAPIKNNQSKKSYKVSS